MSNHKAGFVSIIGKPNVGKSTLMNHLVGERLSIITSKAQTTRHRIMGIINEDDYQIVYSDTPGIIKPKYKLQESMMDFVKNSLEDADVILFVTDIFEKFDESEVVERLKKMDIPIILLVNKIDLADQQKVVEKMQFWQEALAPKEIVPISALHKFNVDHLLDAILEYIPEHPAFFSKEDLTDKPQRFFVSEIIREKILLNFEQEIPYACEVTVHTFKEEADIIRIGADIVVERKSQKAIVIGKGGQALKKVGTQARKDMEAFFQKKVFLEQYVKVDPDWRSHDFKLRRFGYME
ncbi:GTPase Era [Limibacter armeniacum]|uniref:GTPase Era n=1 Tax=Limibacter armeniacum TaxID=466084 RepID=UPI002FE6ABBF